MYVEVGEKKSSKFETRKQQKKDLVKLNNKILLLMTAVLAVRHSTERVKAASSIFIVLIDKIMICIVRTTHY